MFGLVVKRCSAVSEGSATILNHVDGSRNHSWNQGINKRFLNRESQFLHFFLYIMNHTIHKPLYDKQE